MAGGSSAKDGWLRVDKKLLIMLLHSIRASEPLVTAWLIDNMDVRTNEVFAPNGIVSNDGDWFARRGRKLPSRAIWSDCLRTLKSREGRLDVPFIAKVRPGVFMINPAYLYMGSTSKGKNLASRFSELTGARPTSDVDEEGKSKGKKKKKRQYWVKCNWESLVDLLASLAGRESCVVAAMLDLMDGNKRVAATQDMLKHWGDESGDKFSKTTVTRALRMLSGKGARGLAAPFCVQLFYGCYLVNPTYAFWGSEDEKDRISRDFERQLRQRERDLRKKEKEKEKEKKEKEKEKLEAKRLAMAERKAIAVARLKTRERIRQMRTSKGEIRSESQREPSSERKAIAVARLKTRERIRQMRTSKGNGRPESQGEKTEAVRAQSRRKKSD